MSLLEALVLFLVGSAAGGLGALAGIGGGILVVPTLLLYFGLPINQAIGISLLAVIATSSATSSVQVERHVVDIRLGILLELMTTSGAAAAAFMAPYIDKRTLAALFVCFLCVSAINLVKRAWDSRNQKLETEIPPYTVRNWPGGMSASLFAGMMSGLLGVGGGVIKVPAMYLIMGVPLRVATATSNFTIGVTAAASAYIYYGRGDIIVYIAAPLIAGVFSGSIIGAKLAPRVRTTYVLWLFITVAVWMAGQMIYKLAIGGIAR